MKDVLIIGAGPAGLTAGLYVQRAGKTALVLESECFGGQIVNSPEVENYPSLKTVSGYELAQNMLDQTMDAGAEIDMDKIVGIQKNNGFFTVKGEANDYEAKTVIIATGAKNRKLNLPREEAFTGNGVSYCALCDGAFYKNKTVAVNGGGNTAFEDALFLAGICKNVYLIHRRSGFRAEQKLIEELQNKPNVKFILDAEITALNGETKLTSIDVKNKLTGEVSSIDLDGLFVAIGKAPDNAVFSALVDLDESGYIIAAEDCKTSTEGIFVAGDCRVKSVRQLTTATADGTVAAVGACSLLN